MSSKSDYLIYDRANDRILRDSQGDIIYFADKQEAIDDLYGNEEVITLSEYLNIIK